jgi:hypothetical protein
MAHNGFPDPLCPVRPVVTGVFQRQNGYLRDILDPGNAVTLQIKRLTRNVFLQQSSAQFHGHCPLYILPFFVLIDV